MATQKTENQWISMARAKRQNQAHQPTFVYRPAKKNPTFNRPVVSLVSPQPHEIN